MKAPAPIALFAALVFVSSCADELDNFDVTVKGEATIPAATLVETLLQSFPALEGFGQIDLAQSQEFQNQGYSPSDVDSVRTKRLVMRVVSPAGQDLSFLGTVRFLVSTPGLPEKLLAEQTEFPEGAAEVAFEVVRDDLKSYLLAKEGTITTEVEDTSRPEQETVVEVEVTFDVDVNVL